jgi:hypothetical protein
VSGPVTHDRARQLGKAYVAAINGGPEPYAALFAPDAEVTLEGAPATPAAVLAAAPPGRCGYRGVRTAPPGFVVTVRVIADGSADDRPHEIALGPDGLIRTLRAG